MKHFNTLEASEYLEEKYGVKYAVSTLIKYRKDGNGPAYSKLNGKIWYRDADLDFFVESAIHVHP